MKLSVGMAVYDDARGLAFSVQALRLYHAEIHKHLELIIIDNNPKSASGARVRSICKEVREFPCVYQEFTDCVGTSGPRQRIFEVASGDCVLVMDSHVLIPCGELARLLSYYELHPHTRDLLSGPMLYDNLEIEIAATHFTNEWSGEMWGRWGTAWRNKDGSLFTIHPNDDGKCVPMRLFDEQPLSAWDIARDFPDWPDIHHSGHQKEFLKRGYKLAAASETDPPFEIPAMGLGLFTCRKEAWVGFPKNLSSFGGEEWCVHEKFRQAGAKCLCLPFLKWWHFFAYELPPYVQHLTMYGKVRNYYIWHHELGLPLDRVKKEFEGKLSDIEWRLLDMNPANPPRMR